MDKLPFESGNSVSVVVRHGRRKLFFRIDMNGYAKMQITQKITHDEATAN